jgi:aspartyl/asparaginyl beta-hydroxylase (cupin superfamily)
MSEFSNGLEEEDLNQEIQENIIRSNNEIDSSISVAANYYDWIHIFPELQVLYDNVDVLVEEALSITQWIDWPEDDLVPLGGVADWTVFPFLHTFPATDTSKSLWVKSTNQACPRTSNLLKSIPGIRTALFR